jgi:sugar lactone lactonase YvrE
MCRVNDQCVTNDTVNACGATCAQCPNDPNGSATCQAGACVLTCKMGYTACGSTCIATDGDPNHCGGCNTTCASHVCQQGWCTPTIITTGAMPIDLTLDRTANFLYWTDAGQPGTTTGAVMRIHTDGTAGGPLVPMRPRPWGVAVDDQYIYWSESNAPGQVMRANIDGTLASSLLGATTVSNPTRLALHIDALYFITVNMSAGEVYKIPLRPTGAPVALAGGQMMPDGIAFDAGFLYWSTSGDDTVWIYNLTTGTMPSTFAPSQPSPGAIIARGGVIYWVNHGTGTPGTGQVMRADTASGPVVAADMQDTPVALDSDGQYLYWTNFANGNANAGSVARISLADIGTGAAPQVVASGLSNPRNIVVGPGHIFWTNSVPGGSVMRVEKPR